MKHQKLTIVFGDQPPRVIGIKLCTFVNREDVPQLRTVLKKWTRKLNARKQRVASSTPRFNSVAMQAKTHLARFITLVQRAKRAPPFANGMMLLNIALTKEPQCLAT